MPFVQAKCPECGGMLAVDDSKKAAVCQFCGEAFIVQEAVNNYNTYNTYDNRTTYNYGDGAVVNVYENQNPVSALIERVFMFLEDGNFASANDYCEKVLDIEPENVQAYLGKLMVDMKVRQMGSLKDCSESFINNKNYQKIMRFGDDDFRDKVSKLLELCLHNIEETEKNSLYMEATDLYENPEKVQDIEKAEKLFKKISGYKDSVDKAKECLDKYVEMVYQQALENIENQNYEKAIEYLKMIPNCKDSRELIKECEEKYDKVLIETVYQQALERIANEDYAEAIEDLKTIPGWKDSEDLLKKCLMKAIWKKHKTLLIYTIVTLVCVFFLVLQLVFK